MLTCRQTACGAGLHPRHEERQKGSRTDRPSHPIPRAFVANSFAEQHGEFVGRNGIARARRRELNEQRRILFPVRLVTFESLRDWECFDADTGKDSAREIREFFIPDFSQWKDQNSYQQAFDRLLCDLKPEVQKSS